MTLDLSRHPCFNDKVRHRFGRIHLPVAPHCNVQCNFCDRRFDCANESRPGVTSQVLSPGQALAYLDSVMATGRPLSVVGIAGPGDPFANPRETLDTLRLVRGKYPDMLLCVATNGLGLVPHVDALAELQVSHVTITVNAVDPEIGRHIYAWIREPRHAAGSKPGGLRAYRGREAAELLLRRQFESLDALKRCGITVKINTIVIPGVNDHHVAEVAERMAARGADILNCVPLCPVEGTPFASIEQPSASQIAAIRGEAKRHLPMMHHCTRCRADAVGLLGQPVSAECQGLLRQSAALPTDPGHQRPYVAVATQEGMLVNRHLGEADELAVYRETKEGFALVETRPTPEPGGGDRRWRELAASLADCRAVLVSSAGQSPREVLGRAGVKVVLMEGLIEEGLGAVFRGEDIRAPLRREHRCGSGAGCAGNGMGCM
jgi:nitrogen fixation protein NifB